MIKIYLKRAISSILKSCKYFDFACNKKSEKAFILMYHRVIETPLEEYVQPGMYVTAEVFDLHLSALKNKITVIPLEELISRLAAGKRVAKLCSITFDDGWHDNFKTAYPILMKYNVPATVFLTTSFLDTNRSFWPEEFCLHHSNIEENLNLLSLFLEVKLTPNGKNLDHAIKTLKNNFNLRNEYFHLLRKAGRNLSEKKQILSWKEVDDMHKSGLITFGAHTAEHEILGQLSSCKAKVQIQRSKEQIQKHLGVPIRLFSYPDGNYNRQMQNILKELDFIGAVTTKKGFIDPQTNLLEIPRIPIHDDVTRTTGMFLSRIYLECF